MPTRANQLIRILDKVDRQIAEAEVDMLKTLDDEGLLALIQKQADLQVLRKQIEAKLKHAEQIKTALAELSGRELEVFTLIGGGLTTPEIAARLKVGTSTIETYRDRLKEKLDVRSGYELSRRAILWVQRGEHNSPSQGGK